MRTERLLAEQDRFRRSLESANRQAVLWRHCATLAWAVSAMFSQACATTVVPSGALPRDASAEVAISISNEMSRAMRILSPRRIGSPPTRYGTGFGDTYLSRSGRVHQWRRRISDRGQRTRCRSRPTHRAIHTGTGECRGARH